MGLCRVSRRGRALWPGRDQQYPSLALPGHGPVTASSPAGLPSVLVPSGRTEIGGDAFISGEVICLLSWEKPVCGGHGAAREPGGGVSSAARLGGGDCGTDRTEAPRGSGFWGLNGGTGNRSLHLQPRSPPAVALLVGLCGRPLSP